MGEPSGVIVVPVGENPSGRLRSLELNASDHLMTEVSAYGAPLSDLQLDGDNHLLVAHSTPAKGLVGEHGWVSSAWQKQPISQGYSGAIRALITSTTLAAGNNTLNGSVVPAGEIWVIENIAMMYSGTVVGVAIYAMLLSGAVQYNLFAQTPVVSLVRYDRNLQLTLSPGENMQMFIQGATLNDDAYLWYVGRRIDIDQ